MVTVVFDPSLGITKERVMAALDAEGIDTRPFFRPLSSLPAYAGLSSVERARRDNVVAYRLAPYGVNLPSGMNMTPELVGRVCAAVRGVLTPCSV